MIYEFSLRLIFFSDPSSNVFLFLLTPCPFLFQIAHPPCSFFLDKRGLPPDFIEINNPIHCQFYALEPHRSMLARSNIQTYNDLI